MSRDGHGPDRGHDDGSDDNSSQGTPSATPLPSSPNQSTNDDNTTANTGQNQIRFNTLGNATTCTSCTLSWAYTGDPSVLITLNLTLSPTGEGTSGNNFTPTSTKPLRTLATNIPAAAERYTWMVVDVKEGWYSVDAIGSSVSAFDLNAHSDLFVKNGTNVACLTYGDSLPQHRPLSTGELVGIVIGIVAALCVLAVAFLFPRLWRRALPKPKQTRHGPLLLY
ncbi:hypothetical protein AMATHDRAFT_47709 [Amanita thiersii Skay4041]|uniref:Uncharacterized protein n=1 Tax=Amanita thiersii Skay4041 TaxID=703135 RepID=A0A2A9NJB7_9AGAR|nr:hypothetical protein AMATHDRAFT_47709 [Amanita thiersii Skay4041]